MAESVRRNARLGLLLALLGGIAAVAIAMATGLAPDLLQAIANPPVIVRSVLAGTALVSAVWLLIGAIHRINASLLSENALADSLAEADVAMLVRGVRFVFLSAAAFTAAAGWLMADPLPLVIALVIAGVDVVETSFFLLVASRRASR